jgi:hypothetical protein
MRFSDTEKTAKEVTTRTWIYILLSVALLTSIGLAIASVDGFIEYSSLPIGLAKAFMGILMLKLIDDTVFGRIDTIPEIKNKNVSYALIYLANAIIIAACIAGS